MSGMYLPPQFCANDPAMAVQLMRAHPLASVISTDDDGFAFVSHLPLHVSQEADALLLRGHCAKANPHWRYLTARPKVLVCFMGPNDYVSPGVYPDLARVPTWNYLAVQVTAQARVIHEATEKDALLKQLIHDHEPAYAAQWQGLGEAFQHKMLAGIVGFELRVVSLQCTIKLNQHRPESHAALRAHYAQGNDTQRALGEWMDALGLASPGDTHLKPTP